MSEEIIYVVLYSTGDEDEFVPMRAFRLIEDAESYLREDMSCKQMYDGGKVWIPDMDKARKCAQGHAWCVENECPLYRKALDAEGAFYPCEDYYSIPEKSDFDEFFAIRLLPLS